MSVIPFWMIFLLPFLTQVNRHSLEKDISSEELLSTMAILQKGKSPG